MSLDGLLVYRQGSTIVGALLTIESPGRTLLLWPPKARGNVAAERDATETTLLQAVGSFAQSRRCRLAQLLLGPEEQRHAPQLEAAGFFHLACLRYLRHNLRHKPPESQIDSLEYETYCPELHEAFLEVLARSYQDSLDCPELTGVRQPQEIFDSHRSQGEFDPNRWLLVRQDDDWIGCLLLVGLTELSALEVAYIAVLPEARGRGIGRELTRLAVREATAAGVNMLTLAVDDRNVPALRMYESEGFEQWDERDAYLLLLDPADGRFDRRSSHD
jgi:ribosomal protein S18 acetylase RimI-like enzyme